MAKTEKKSRSFTFGNFLLSLLVLGLFVVIGLMVMLYLELSRTPETTAANYQRQQEKVSQVQVLSPNDKMGDNPVYRDKQVSVSQVLDTPKEAVNPEPVEMVASEPVEKINNAALSNGVTAKKTNTTPKKNSDSVTRKNNHNNDVVAVETPLEPINKPKKPAQRASDNKERELKPINARPARTQPKNSDTSAINDLF
ncbi:hypothetical protein [Wielerella bovis]|uniref:hypothetical protein n=1 Tax=Wielerella bovis TaxID=2917790 RepID=UPI00201A10D6|nr:hypothetical protein [Wielerella bovis]ULJ61404.1 hypothetical protein MIS44_06075 [Wielerella bovis]